jgi:crossover junction endodeoxyribonuclease RuvC
VKEPKTAIIGADPGMDGGLALMILNSRGEPDKLIVKVMPTKPAAKGRDVDGREIGAFIDSANDYDADIKLACIEIVHSMPKQGVASSFNFGKSYGRLLGVFEAMLIPVHDVTPQMWKKAILGGLGKEKEDSIRYAISHYPKINFKATEKCTTNHDGMAEAVCLAEYGRRMLIQGDAAQKKIEEAVNKPKSGKDPVLQIIDEDGYLEWILTYTTSAGRRNTVVLESDPNSEDKALVEAATFLKIDSEEIEIVK